MSIETMTAPPTHRQQYLQPENQERLIERQLNISHQSNMSSYQSSYSEQQSIYSSSSQPNVHHTSTSDSAANLSNITSASLANLCKGVEQNLSQISKNGPYGDIPPPSSSAGGHGESQPPPMSSGSQGPSVNNTYVNAHMSIGQLNIQNVTANQNYQGPGMPRHMQQNVDVSMNNFNGSMMPQHPPEPIYKPPQSVAAPAVSIQNKGRNTISYLPVTQPSLPSSHEPAIPPKASFDFMSSDRYPSPSAGFYPPDGGPGGPIMGPQISPHSRHPGPMYGGPPTQGRSSIISSSSVY